MNTLDVTKFGVQELDHKEMVEIEGGTSPAHNALLLSVDAVYFDSFFRGIRDGFVEAYDEIIESNKPYNAA